MSRKQLEIISTGIMTLLSIFLIISSRELSYKGNYGPGPGFFPLWIGVFMFVCSIAVWIKIQKSLGEEETDKPLFAPKGITKVLTMIGLTLAAAFLFEIIGSLPIIFLYLVVILRRMGGHKWHTVIVFSLCFAMGVYFLFEMSVGVVLPHGILSILFG